MPRVKWLASALGVVLVTSWCLGLAACAAAPSVDPALPMTVAPATAEAWRAGPVQTKLQAAIAAQSDLGATRLHYAVSPQIIFIWQMSFDQAHRRARTSGGPGSGSDVWLVIVEGDYQIIPPGMPTTVPDVTPTPIPVVHGCAFVIMTTADGMPLSMGTMTSCN